MSHGTSFKVFSSQLRSYQGVWPTYLPLDRPPGGSRAEAQGKGDAPESFMSDIGAFLPIAVSSLDADAPSSGVVER
jgi:hypothetical protein